MILKPVFAAAIAGIPMVWVWLGLMVLFLAGEAITPGTLASIWFAAGALAALLVELMGAPLWLSAAVFVVVSVALLVLTRPLALKYVNGKKQATNADRMLGDTGVVTEEINNLENRGLVKVDGKVWTARSSGCEPIPTGARVRVLRIEGVKAIVEPLPCEVPA